jgi:hypothetical protein
MRARACLARAGPRLSRSCGVERSVCESGQLGELPRVWLVFVGRCSHVPDT